MRYAVIVKKHILEPGSKPALAASLSAVLGARQEQLLALLERGPLTIEADLSRAEARALCERLIKRAIPAQIFDELGDEDPEQVNTPAFTLGAAAAPKAPPKVSLFDDDEIMDALDGLELSAFGAESPPATNHQPRPSPPLESESAWGQVLGGWSAPEVVAPVAPGVARQERAPAADSGWASLGFGGSAPLEDAGEAAAPRAAAPVVVTSPDASLGFGAEPMTSAASAAREPSIAFTRPSSTPPPQQLASSGPMRIEDPDVPRVASASAAPQAAPRRPDRFDGGAITDAFTGPDEGDRPPYMPHGYDERPPHSAEIAFGLSILAPGAGQVYNGEPEKALGFGAWFFLVMPWVKSAKEAKARGARIATYYAPRPEDGSLNRALRYAGIWYLCVILTLSFFGWGVSKLVERMTREPEVKIVPLVVVADSVRNASFRVMKAVDVSWGSLDEAEAQWKEAQMSDEERAERLFLISLPECKMSNFVVCASSMKRVTQLNSRHPHAFKVQVWAQLRQRTSEALPMPEIPGYQSILDYENKIDLGQPQPASDMGEAGVIDAGDLGRSSPAAQD